PRGRFRTHDDSQPCPAGARDLRAGHSSAHGTARHRAPPLRPFGRPHRRAHRCRHRGLGRILVMTTIVELDRRHVWHPFTQMRAWLDDEPLVIASAQGNHLIDQQGRSYLDGVSSLWVNLHGHRRPEIDDAIRAQLDRVAHTTLLGLASPPAALLAERLIRIAPPGLAKVFYSDSGSTAVEVALKMAYQYFHHRGRSRKLRF